MTLPELARSFAGCDGGNVEADLWVCGIEPHGDFGVLGEAQQYLSPRRPEWREPPCWPSEFAAKLLQKQRGDLPAKLHKAWRLKKGAYDWLLGSLCWRVFGQAANASEYLKQRLYQVHGDIFKLNLFPLTCNRDNESEQHWTSEHQAYSHCTLKGDYVQKIISHRAPFFRALVARDDRRVIIRTSVTRRSEFVAMFLADPRPPKGEAIRVRGKRIFRYRNGDSNRRLLVTPFLGGGKGMLNEADLIELAGEIRCLLPAKS